MADIVIGMNPDEWFYSIRPDTELGLRWIQSHPYFGQRYRPWIHRQPVTIGNYQHYPAARLVKDARRAGISYRWRPFGKNRKGR